MKQVAEYSARDLAAINVCSRRPGSGEIAGMESHRTVDARAVLSGVVADSPPPAWVDDLFPFPTPRAFCTLVDIAWQAACTSFKESGTYAYGLLETHYDFMFDLAMIPRPPNGWECDPEFDVETRKPSLPLFATPEFVSFGALGDGGHIGWLVPAPELGRRDHPVALASGHDFGVTFIGADTRAGLEFMLSRALRWFREDPEPALADSRAQDRQLIDRLAAELGVHPDPDRKYAGSSWKYGWVVERDRKFQLEFDVPEGWRHDIGEDGIGVLAPAAAYADWSPVVADVRLRNEPLQPVLSAAARALDAGHPATALLGLKDTFVNAPSCYFGDLKPLWARAYQDLGRPEFAERLDLMTGTYHP
ncbi:hypothetical protein O7626_38075 [Micromonospora sp. WMMD1102]|uniref:hypothetical protein n=1 Tax=Micromonospora sp. WMMD1102 TaxID=3016105 RepID=UPI0024158F5C|nr:hypothetical protein [Micromonospora sp. WMMD1102]MDG4791640.1 hypothetical protein [Micromonospora sp. WMMD1102]